MRDNTRALCTVRSGYSVREDRTVLTNAARYKRRIKFSEVIPIGKTVTLFVNKEISRERAEIMGKFGDRPRFVYARTTVARTTAARTTAATCSP